MIVRDEAESLPRCLESLKDWVDEIVVVDTGSSDDTMTIARSFGARVAAFAWRDDFSRARNVALQLAKKDWVLVVDADEALAQETGPALRAALVEDAMAYRVELEGHVATGRLGTDSPVRLFRNDPRIRFSRRINETVTEHLRAIGITDPPRCGVRLRQLGDRLARIAQREIPERNRRLLRRQTTERPDDIDSLYQLSKLQTDDAQHEARLQLFRKIVAVADGLSHQARARHPWLPDVYDTLATDLASWGQLSRALQLLRRAIAKFPDAIELTCRCGEVLVCAGHYAKAMAEFESCLETADTLLTAASGVRSWMGVARAGFATSEAATARYALNRALALEPKNLEARCMTVRILFGSGETDRLTAVHSSLLALAPRAAEVRLLCGELAWTGGEFGDARTLFRAAAGTCNAGNTAQAWLTIAALAEDAPNAQEVAAAIVARDVDTHAVQIISAVIHEREISSDSVFAASALRTSVAHWLKALLAGGGTQAIQRFSDNVGYYDDDYPWITELVSED